MATLKNFFSIQYWALSLLLAAMSSAAMAQRHTHGSEQLESIRIALITERLALTPEAAQQFWPVYNQISDEFAKLKRESFYHQRAYTADSLTDEQAQKQITAYLNTKKQELALEEKAIAAYGKVLSPGQVMKLLKVERDFQHMMLKQLSRRGRRPSTNDRSRRSDGKSDGLAPDEDHVDEDDIF